ncbi:MAG: class I SAM-dependent methyltransferase [Candidatus Bathyarchaeota archaeon]|nr:class I SAM-dependent methyltransferase [Candidatus Bathyarchaeota archaeon]
MALLDNYDTILVNRPWLRKVILRFLFMPALQGFFESLSLHTADHLKKEADQCTSIEEFVDLAFKFTRYILLNIAPLQIKKEFASLLKILEKNKPQYVLELGTARGGALFLLARIAKPNATIISVDLPQGEYGGVWYPNWKMMLYRSFAIDQQKLYLVRKDSHARSTVDLIKTLLNQQKLDFIFIDADHTYEGVKNDFYAYSPLVRKGGLIAFHDICAGPQELVGGVSKFWNEIKPIYKHQEIVASSNQKGFGIGIIYT